MEKKFNPDWLIEELQIQLSVLEMTDEKKKVYDVIRAIEILKKDLNVFYFPAVMNFVSIQRPFPPPVPPVQVPLPPVPQPPYHMGGQVFNPNTNGISPSGIPASAVPSPAPGRCSPVPAMPVSSYPSIHACQPVSVYPSWNNNPKPGDRIFGIFNDDENGSGVCLYTWQEEDNPEEIHSYSVGFDQFYPAGKRYMPCKKHHHDKFMVICTSECCNQE